MSSDLQYRSRAVRALVLLHEEYLRGFLQTWRRALATSVILPPTDDPAYASLGAWGRHVLSAAGGYMVWMCEMLTLPDPCIRTAPDADAIVRDAGDYMEHVLERWLAPLKDISNEQLKLPSTLHDGRPATLSTLCWSMQLCTPFATPSSWMS